jgi:hypothetical protein
MRDWKKEYSTQLKRGDDAGQLERQKARRLYDKKGIPRKGKDIDHVVALSKGGTNAPSNLRLTSPSKNRSFSRNKDGSMKANDNGNKKR